MVSDKFAYRILDRENVFVNQIRPHKNKWAWDLFLIGNNNNWNPNKIPMSDDISQWYSSDLSDDERLVIKRCLGFFAGAESLVSNNLFLNIFEPICDGECRQFIFRQGYEECYSDDTEVLTPSGWILFKDLNKEHKVAQYNENGSINFVLPTKLVEHEYDGELYSFKNKNGHIDLLVTPKHRMVYRHEDSNDVSIEFAESIKYTHKLFICAGLKEGNIDVLTDKDRLAIAYQADGTPSGGYSEDGPNRDGSRNGGLFLITFTFTKERKINRLLDIINRLGLKYNTSEPDSRERIRIYVWVNIEDKPSKYFKDWVNLEDKSYKWCREFLEEASHWDGYKTPGYNHIGYDSTIGNNTDIVQAICALAGYRSKKHIKEDNRSETFNDLHRLSITKDKDSICRGVINKDTKYYKGKVYCASVPSGMLLVRRNGGVGVSGNSLHNQTIVYICDSLNLDEKELYEAYKNIPVVKRKDDFLMKWTSDAMDASTEQVIKNIFTYYIICEGILFYSSFAILLSFGRQGKIPGIVSQINYTLRDEANHVQFGTELLNVIQREYPEIFTDSFKNKLIDITREAILLEEDFAKEVLPNGILGINSELLIKYVKFTANKRLTNLGLSPVFDCTVNPFPWLSEVVDMDKMTNYFERPVQNYATGAVIDDY